MKGYTVFNVEQIEGLPEHYYVKPEMKTTPVERISHAEEFFQRPEPMSATGATAPITVLKATTSRCRSSRHSAMPKAFMRRSRMNRAIGRNIPHGLTAILAASSWGDEGYASEELVADSAALSSARISALTPEVRDDHASYIAYWLTVLKNDKRAIFSAAAHAQKAVDYLHGLKAPAETESAHSSRLVPL